MEKIIDYSTKRDVWLAPKIYKGIAYFPSYAAAHTIMRHRVPAGRVVEYDRGYAIQYWISGPYYPKHEMK